MEELLNKAFWNNEDIMEFAGVGVNKASSIRKEAILHYGGLIPMLPSKVRKTSVLLALGVYDCLKDEEVQCLYANLKEDEAIAVSRRCIKDIKRDAVLKALEELRWKI